MINKKPPYICNTQKIEKGQGFIWIETNYDNAMFIGRISTVISKKHNTAKYQEIADYLGSIYSDKSISDFIPIGEEFFDFDTADDSFFLGVISLDPEEAIGLDYILNVINKEQ